MHLVKFVFAQIVEFIPRFEFDKCVKQYNGDFHVRSLNSYNHLSQSLADRGAFQVDKAKYDRKTNVGLLGKCHTNAFVDSNYLLLADSEDKG